MVDSNGGIGGLTKLGIDSSNSSMVDSNVYFLCAVNCNCRVQIPLWSIVTQLETEEQQIRESSNSSMVDSN